MLPIAALHLHTATRQALVGSRANDPAVSDHVAEPGPLELGRFSEGVEVHPAPSSLWRVGRFSDGLSREVGDLDGRRAA